MINSKSRMVQFILFIISVLVLFYTESFGQNASVKKYTPSFSKLNFTNFSAFICNNGIIDQTPSAGPGFEFPYGTKKKMGNYSGFLWGAKIDSQIRVGGSSSISGLLPGRIISNGIHSDPNSPGNRAFRVRPDYKTASLIFEAVDEGKSEAEIYSQYEKDWNEWPAAYGAPYTDIDKDGRYDPDVDIPGIKDAVQTIWFTANDLDSSACVNLYGAPPCGIELQSTLWTYNHNFILNNTYFKKYTLINKSSSQFRDMFVAFYADPDIGDISDDFAGCDTLLDLAYVYNADNMDYIYGNNPPAMGIQLLQGPIIKGNPGDTAFYSGRVSAGKKNLNSTSFYYYISSGYDCLCGPPYTGNNPVYAKRIYLYMQGLKYESENIPVPGGGYTKFPLSGDPVNNSGFLDGKVYSKGDRSFIFNSGPFEMMPGDTQEVVCAEIAAQSTGNLTSVTLLKNMAFELKKYYSSRFNFLNAAPVPPSPRATLTYSSDGIKVKWERNSESENFQKDGYKFQGYNIYQFSPYYMGWKRSLRITTFDIKDGITDIKDEGIDTLTGKIIIESKVSGTDSGLSDNFLINNDIIGSSPLYKGQKYYLGVSSYAFCHSSDGKNTYSESPVTNLSVTFQDSLPGLRFSDTLRTMRSGGHSDARITPVVLDASKITGNDYQVFFEESGDSLTFSVREIKTGEIKIRNKRITKGREYINNPDGAGTVTIEGIRLSVIDAPVGMKSWNASDKLIWVPYNESPAYFNLPGYGGTIGDGPVDWNFYNGDSGSTVKPSEIPNTLIRFAGTDTSGNILDQDDPNISYSYRYLRSAQLSPAKIAFTYFIKDKSQSYAFQDYTKSLPFSAFNYDTGERLMVGFLENNVFNGMVDGKYWPPYINNKLGNSSTTSPREWFFIFNVPYGEVPDPKLQVPIYSQRTPVLWFGVPSRKPNMGFTKGDEFLIIKNNLITKNDLFSFKTDYLTSVKGNEIPMHFSLNQNFPNPFNPLTIISYTISEKSFVELKIFDILGREITTLVKKEQSSGNYKVQFDGSSLPSGVYIYTIQAGSYRDSKKLLLLK